MKVVIDGGGFGADLVVCDLETATEVLRLLPKLRPIKSEYVPNVGYKYTLLAQRRTNIIMTVVPDDRVCLPEDLKELVGVMRETQDRSAAQQIQTDAIVDTGLNTEASRTDKMPF